MSRRGAEIEAETETASDGRHRRTRVRMVGVSEAALRLSRGRLFLAATLFTLAFTVLGGRLIALAVLTDPAEPRDGRAGPATVAATDRGDIVDRNGILLASNLLTASLYADPSKMIDKDDAIAKIQTELPDITGSDLRAKIYSDRGFVWIKRNLTPRQQRRINNLGVPGLAFQPEQRRVYPHGALFAHVLGFTDVDNNGIAGVEQRFNEELAERARRGEVLTLSLDLRIQHALRDELDRAMGKFKAIGAAGVVLDARSGEVMAMVSLPDFDPNHPGSSPKNNRFNRATKGVYELGSVFKAFTLAMALDRGTVKMSSGFDATHPIRISRFTIRDDHPKKRWLSVPEIFQYSSNIGAAKMAAAVGSAGQRDFMERIGMLRPVPLELPEVGRPLSPKRWRAINTMTIAFGHGLAVSPMHLANGIAALVNGGVLLPATLLRRDPDLPIHGDRVISTGTSRQMRRLLRLVVEKGTGRQANAPRYLVGGKTGTAEKAGVRGYRRRALLSSFVAAFPMNDPAYVVYTFLDEPKGIKETHGFAGGGWTAAPTTGRIITRIAPILGVRPIDEDDEAIKSAMTIKRTARGARLATY